jgi:hypothetical protein
MPTFIQVVIINFFVEILKWAKQYLMLLVADFERVE